MSPTGIADSAIAAAVALMKGTALTHGYTASVALTKNDSLVNQPK